MACELLFLESFKRLQLLSSSSGVAVCVLIPILNCS